MSERLAPAGLARPFVLFGYLGGRNLGDDAMLAGFFDAARASGRSFIVLARDPAAVEVPSGLTVEILPATMGSAWSALRRAAGAARIGGTSFHDEYEDGFARSMLVKYLKLSALYLLPRLMGKPVAALGVGFGSIHRTSTGLVARLAMRACDAVIVRDPASLDIVRRVAPGARSSLGVDLAFLSAAHARPLPNTEVGLSILDLEPYGFSNESQDQFWLEAADAALRQADGVRKVRLFVFKDNERESDMPVTQRLADSLCRRGLEVSILSHGIGLGAMRTAIGECGVFLATRYHAAIMAGQAGARLLIVPYNDKLRHFARDVQLGSNAIIEPGSSGPFRSTAQEARPSADFATRTECLRQAVNILLRAT